MKFEKFAWEGLEPLPIVGVDEAGRGCLAGPVCAGAVVLSPQADLSGITDSKAISEVRREEIFERIILQNKVGIGFASVEEIDQINILNATFLAMRRAIAGLGVKGGHILVDGNMAVRGLTGFHQTPLVKGDLRAAPISAASIVAKVSRDRLMRKLATEFPDYGFEVHKGYGTEDHRAAIRLQGPTPHHRKTFAGVKEFCRPPETASLLRPRPLG